MKKSILIASAVLSLIALPATASFSQQHEMAKPPSQQGQGAAGEYTHGGMMGMMCPMMGMPMTGGMGGMGGMMGGMMGGTMRGMAAGDPKMMGRLLEMRGEMLMKIGEVMMKHGKMWQKESAK